MLLIMIPDQYPNSNKVLEIYIGYFDGLNIFFIDTQTSKELIQMDINKMMTK